MRLIHLFLFLAATLFSTFLQLNSASAYSQCHPDQKSLLLQLVQTLEFDPYYTCTKMNTWNSSTNCCEWLGVTCNIGGLIIGIDLSFEPIVGGINNSSTLFDLQHLETLNLAFISINGSQIPSGIHKLRNLKNLSMSSAGFRGQIPIEISGLTRLVSLDLSDFYHSYLSELKLENPNLRRLVQNLTHLVELSLDGVNISTNGEDWCQALSSAMPNLQVLTLSSCSLRGPIHPCLAKFQSLSVIRLDDNDFSAPVPEFLTNFKNLTTLTLCNCQLIGTFPEDLFRVPSLETLELSGNKFLQGSFPAFLQNLSLRNLLLSETSFSGTLPLSIGNLGKLSRMELAGCKFGGPIPNSVANLTQLSHLDLSNNMFTGPIPPLHMCNNLTYIYFSKNKLSDISSTRWESLKNLIDLDLENNSLGGNIPSLLLSIPSLQKVWLSSNRFRGNIPDFSNASSSNLDTLDLSDNKLEGSIPSSIFDLQKLTVLSLSFNIFNDSIELGKFWRLGNLTDLDLSHSNLSINASGSYSNFTSPPFFRALKLASCSLKEFPDLRKQSYLAHLDLSDNQIDGIIPKWIWGVGNGDLNSLNLASNLLVGLEQPPSLPILRMLDLHDNQLQGNIPPLPPYATYVDYSSNRFSSVIPSNIGDFLTYAYFFSLSNNSFTGVIPESLCTAAYYLKVLDLSHNNLNGTIPACVIKGIKSLGVLNLRRNKFVGNVPDIFPNACKLQTLDLSGNLLVEKVPKSLVNCTVLEVLDLGNNQMEDVFPCPLTSISSLRVLVLRSNKFYGGINCSQEHDIWPRLQIVNIASNNFSGRLPMELLTSSGPMKGYGKETGDHLRFNPLQLTPLYYQDSITVTSKGVEMEFVKILKAFTSIDFSSNRFEGHVPEAIGQLRALLGLNLSHNALAGSIPSSCGNLSELESLDLSFNNLNGPIPEQLAHLTFLGFLNLSYNRLVGKIPTSTQLQTFSAASFEGNDGLCGPPLSVCFMPESPSFDHSDSSSGSEIDWNPITAELGFSFGLGIIIVPLMFSKRWRIKYYTHVDDVLYRIFPQLDERIRNQQRKSRRNRRR